MLRAVPGPLTFPYKLQMLLHMLLLTVILLFAVCTGPTSSVYATIEPDSDKNLKVTYMPAEVGVYTITMAWNDVEVVGEFSHGFK